MKITPEKAVARSGKPFPAGWWRVRLGKVCELNPRRPELKRADNAPTTFVPMSAVEGNGQGIQRAEIKPFWEVRKGYTYFGEGDVLFAKIPHVVGPSSSPATNHGPFLPQFGQAKEGNTPPTPFGSW